MTCVKLAAVGASSSPKKAVAPVAKPPVKLTVPLRKLAAMLENVVLGPL